MGKRNKDVNGCLVNNPKWNQEIELLRDILLQFDLKEEFKWNKPAYTYEGNNIVVIQGFKEYCALLFVKGILIDDKRGVLIKTGKNTRVGRQIRFHNVDEVKKLKKEIKDYINKAIEAEKSGEKFKPANTPEITLPQELEERFEEDEALREAFYKLTPGRQRAYVFYFSSPKNSSTRESRIEKCRDTIIEGIGLNDQ